jgi:hypothetical protein
MVQLPARPQNCSMRILALRRRVSRFAALPRLAQAPAAARPDAQAEVDAQLQAVAERASAPLIRYRASSKPEMNRQERLIVTAYVVMGAMLLTFLMAVAVAWLSGS